MNSYTSLAADFARIIHDVLAAPDTPPPLAARMRYCISELRDQLPPEAARRVDGILAEAVITCFASDVLWPDANNQLSSCRTTHEQQSKSANTGE